MDLFTAPSLRRILRVSAWGLAIVTSAPCAEAQPSPADHASARLIYTVEPSAGQCPDEAAFRQTVASRIGYDPFDVHAGPSLHATITRTRDGLVGRVAPRDADDREVGSREVNARGLSCADLVDVMAVTVTLALEQPALRAQALPSPTPAPPAPAAVALSPPSEPYVAVSRASLTALTAEASLHRMEETLADHAGAYRGFSVGFAIGASTLGALLLGLGVYAGTSGERASRDVGITLGSTGAALLVGGVAIAILSGRSTAELRESIRRDRANGVPAADALVRARRMWESLAAQSQDARVREGIASLGAGVLLSAGCAVVMVSRLDSSSVESTALHAATVLGAGAAAFGVWRLAARDPLEQGWEVYRRVRAPVIVPLATPAPGGATLGVVVAW